MNSISNNPVYIEGIRYTTGIDSFQNGSNNPGTSNVSYDKYLSQDNKNIIVTEKPDKSPAAANLYKYQYNAPAFKLMSTGQTFNEIEKPLNNNSKSSSSNPGTTGNPAQYNYVNNNSASGYFIFDTFRERKLNKEQNSKPPNPMKKKLENAYHLNKGGDAGSLVNMIFY